MSEKKEMTKIKVIVRKGETKDGKEFNAYKMVGENGKLIDLHFRKDVETSKFGDLQKFMVNAGYVQISNAYEFPRVYVGELDYETIEDCFSK